MIGGGGHEQLSHLRTFSQLVAKIDEKLLTEDRRAAAQWIQIAGHFAWFFNPGGFSSPQLDHLADQVLEPDAALPLQREAARTLHVATSISKTGGHSRLLLRWLELESGAADVILTAQIGQIPEDLRVAVESTGGRLRLLNAPDAYEKARELRGIAGQADLILLHTHPYDAIPFMAFPTASRTVRLAVVNHADHVFWTGASLADAVINIRAAGSSFSVANRGVQASRSHVLSLPLSTPQQNPDSDRETTRRKLEVAPDQILALSMAQAYKYQDRSGASFLETYLPLVKKDPRLSLFVIGPEPTKNWRQSRTGSTRVRALGPRLDTAALFAAADVYVDSYPFASLTSALEASVAGLPIVAVRSNGGDVFSLDDPGLNESLVLAASGAIARGQLQGLIDSPTDRRVLAERQKEAVLSHHCGEPWAQEWSAVRARIQKVEIIAPEAGALLLAPAEAAAVAAVLDLHGQPAMERDAWTLMSPHAGGLKRSMTTRLLLLLSGLLKAAKVPGRDRLSATLISLLARAG
jgi:hypothetical protein